MKEQETCPKCKRLIPKGFAMCDICHADYERQKRYQLLNAPNGQPDPAQGYHQTHSKLDLQNACYLHYNTILEEVERGFLQVELIKVALARVARLQSLMERRRLEEGNEPLHVYVDTLRHYLKTGIEPEFPWITRCAR